LILSQFEGEEDRHKSYREQVQKYAKEEKQLFEDLRHGLILGSARFVEEIRKKYLPSKLDAALPQQKQLSTVFDLENFLVKAPRRLNCDIKNFVQAGRLSEADKDKRDLLLYLIWRAGHLSNAQIGNLFGISYSAVSQSQIKKDQ
jgi:hypothetical protein